MVRTSTRVEGFTESVIREMTRLCEQYDAINLAQGYPDFEAPEPVKAAAIKAIRRDHNQYSITYGLRTLREAIAGKMKHYNHIVCDPDSEVTVTCGTSEAMAAALFGILDPGDEVVIFEPFYENYGPDTILSGASCKYVPLSEPDFSFDEEALKEAFSRKTKAIIVNTPHNPTGKVYTRKELRVIADLCVDYDAVAVTDEVYEYILYDGAQHISLGSLGDMRERTVTISGFSKTYTVTGWRVGYAVAEKKLMVPLRKVHDFLTVCAPTPLQEACLSSLSLRKGYYQDLAETYSHGRTMLLDALERNAMKPFKPRGSYYIWTDVSQLGFNDDVSLARELVRKVHVGAVPGSSFFQNPRPGRQRLRFSFSKKPVTIRKATKSLDRISQAGLAAD